jgi:hypothetical protein
MKCINNTIRNKSLVSNLVFCITAFLLFACGSGDSGGSGSISGGSTGSIAFTLDIQDNLVASSRQIAAADPTSDHALIASVKQSSVQVLDAPLMPRLSMMLQAILPAKLLSDVWLLAPIMAYADSVPKSDGLTARNTRLLAQASDDGIDCEAHQIGEIEAYVFDEEGIEIAEGGPWPCGLHVGIIKNVPARDYIKIVLFATAHDSGEYIYRGEKGGHDDPIVGIITLDPIDIPNAPLEFEASDGQFTDRIKLSWQDVKHDDGYYIDRLENDEWIPIGDTNMDATVFVDYYPACTPYGEPPVIYYYRVRAYNNYGESAEEDSEPDSGFTGDCPIVKPDPPFNLNASDGDLSGQIRLTWQWDGDGPLDEFRIYRSESPDGPWGEPIDRPTAEKRTYEDSDLVCPPYGEPPILYYYMVRAYNSAGLSKNSESDSGFTADFPVDVPVAPVYLNAGVGEYPDRIMLTWEWEGVETLTGFRIYRTKESVPDWDNYFYEQLHDPTSRSYTDTEVNCDGETWNYMVRAYNCGGESPDSEQATGSTADCLSCNIISSQWTGSGDETWSGCEDSDDDREYPSDVTLRIEEQTPDPGNEGDEFRGSATITSPLLPGAHSEVALTGLLQPDGQIINGFYSYTDYDSAGNWDSEGEGTFSGSVSNDCNQISISYLGKDTKGDTCVIDGSFTVNR